MTEPFASSFRLKLSIALALLAVLAAVGAARVRESSDQSAQTGPGAGQAPAVTFKVDINYVEVPAVIVDRQGRFVDSLQQSDFEIYEDGRKQPLSGFVLVNAGRAKADAPLFLGRAIEPDVHTNTVPFDGRLYVILMDDLHVEALTTTLARAAAKRFVETQLGADDLAAVICASGRPGASQDFTADRQLLLHAIDQFMGRRLPSATRNRIDKFVTQNSAGAGNKAMLDTRPVVDIDERERLSNAQRTLSAIRAASNALSSIHGRRKAIVMFSEGIDAAISNITAGAAQGEGTDMNVANLLPGAAGETQRDAEDAMAAAIKADVSIYGVDPGGLKGIGGAADITVPIEADPTAGMTLQSIDGELRLQLESLRRLSVNTGGFAAINTNDLGPSFDRIREDNSRYYLLGYYPTATKADGKYHRLDVKVLKPGLQVRARAGYLAARPGSNPSTSPADASSKIPPALRDVLDNPLPVPGVRLTASATPGRNASGGTAITAVLLVDGRDIRFKEKDGRFDGQLTLSMLATDAEGKVKGSGARAISLPLRPDSYAQVSSNGIRIVDQIDVPAGRYRLRIAVMDVDSQRIGSVHCDVNLTELEQTPLAMSGLLMTSSTAGATPTAPGALVESLRKVLPGPPTVSRTFKNSEVLGVAAQVYDKVPDLHTVDITTTLKNTDGLSVFRNEDQRSSAELAPNGGFYRYSVMLPLRGLGPGLYVLTVEARSRLAEKQPVQRQVQFEILE